MLEQAPDDADRPLGFHAQHGLAETGGGRRSEQPRALERRFRVRTATPRLLVHDLFEHRPRVGEVVRRDGLVPVGLPTA